jgi:6-pyruvoyltetrahydropterin/6-carboxytetrahydropterin synthase
MFRLTREVRFAINSLPDDQLDRPPTNSFGGYPSSTGFGQYFRLQITLEGQLNPVSSYLRNIKEIDDVVRKRIVGAMGGSAVLLRAGYSDLARISIWEIFAVLDRAWSGDKLHSATLWLTPYLSLTQLATEYPMHTRLSQKFEFSASHRLHNPSLSDEENRGIFGKCNHPGGHGHNYELQVTLRGQPSRNGLLVDVPAFEKIVQEYAIEKLDHKNLNCDVAEFQGVIPTVENIAMVIFRMLKSRFTGIGAELASVTVWETAKTWCEYSE